MPKWQCQNGRSDNSIAAGRSDNPVPARSDNEVAPSSDNTGSDNKGEVMGLRLRSMVMGRGEGRGPITDADLAEYYRTSGRTQRPITGVGARSDKVGRLSAPSEVEFN